MAQRDFIITVTKMLFYIPDDDELKQSLKKIIKKFSYKAPEIRIIAWQEVQECLIERFGEIKIEEQDEWIQNCLNVWTNKI
jgi:hypothetical protein